MKTKFKSQFGGGDITPAQYIIECLCILVAQQRKITLVDKFWNEKEWNTFFRWQIKYANKLLKVYSVDAIVKGLRDKRLINLQSLSHKAKWKWKKVFDEYQRDFDQKQNLQTTTINKNTVHVPQKTGNKTPLSKLK